MNMLWKVDVTVSQLGCFHIMLQAGQVDISGTQIWSKSGFALNIIFDNYPNSSPDQSAGTPEYQMMGPVRGQEDVASEGLGQLRKGHLTGWKKKLNYHAWGICSFSTGH